MSKHIESLIENNRRWAASFEQENPGFFKNLANQQNPQYLWIGCSDSRVPANTIVGLEPGQVFVHRNVANLVNHSDLNVLSVIEYAVKVLKVTDIIVCGHYGCGGVQAALSRKQQGLVDNWLKSIKDVYRDNQLRFTKLDDDAAKLDLLCELNVMEQVQNVCRTSIVQNAWAEGRELSVHGVIYSVGNGLLKDLKVTTNGVDGIEAVYHLLHQQS